MKANTKSILQCVVVLSAIALVCGLLLGAVNLFTYVNPLTAAYEKFASDTGLAFTVPEEDEEEDEEERETTYTMTVTVAGSEKTLTGWVEYYALSDDGTVHAFLGAGKGGYGGTVEMYVYITDGTIYQIVEGDNTETYIDRLEESYYDQFLGRSVSELVNGLDVDYVSGATKSSTAVTAAIMAVASYYNNYIAEDDSVLEAANG